MKHIITLLFIFSVLNAHAEDAPKASPVKKVANEVDRTAREAVVEVKKAAKTIGSKLNSKSSSDEDKKKDLKE